MEAQERYADVRVVDGWVIIETDMVRWEFTPEEAMGASQALASAAHRAYAQAEEAEN